MFFTSRPHRHLVGYFLILVVFGSIIALTFIGLYKSDERAESLKRTGEVRAQVSLLLSALQDAETGQRGYLLTGEERYLAPYKAALPAIAKYSAALRVSASNTPRQTEHLGRLDSVIGQKLAELAQTIALRRQGNLPAALAIVIAGSGQSLMDQARLFLAEIGQQENRNWQIRTAEVAQIASRLKIEVLLSSFVIAALLGLGFRRINREEGLRVDAYRALSIVEERHQLAVQAAGLGTWSWDLEKDELLWSDRFITLFGLPLNTPVNYAVFESALHPEDRQRTNEAVQRSLNDFTDYDMAYRTVWPDGSIHWLRAKGKSYANPDGKAILFQGIVIDIDRQEKAREALDASENRYAALFRNKVNAIAHCRSIYNSEGKPIDYDILEINQAYENITGLKKADVENRTALQVFPGIDNFEFDFIGEYGRIARDGSEISFETYFAPFNQWLAVYAYSPAPGEFVAIFTDVSSRKNSEQALLKSEQRLRLAQSGAGVAVWEWHSQSGQMDFTPEVYGMYALEPGSLQTYANWRHSIHPEDKARVETEQRLLLDRGGAFVSEFRIVHANGEVQWVEEKGTAVPDASGSFTRIVGMGIDVSGRKLLEAELRQFNDTLEKRVAGRTAELASANRELEAFSYSVSHDLRSPLRGIDGFSRILLSDFASELSPKPVRYLQLIRDNARRMGQLIDDLLVFSQLSRQQLQKQTVYPVPLIKQILEELEGERRGRTIHFNLADLPPCQAEPAMLKQVWANLLSNAIKFTAKRQVAEIEIGFLDSPKTESPTYFVRDNGAGFDMRYVDKLFGIFQRLHRTEDYEGTGVGLAIVARIIHRHGGEIVAVGIPGQQATFSFNLSGVPKNGAPLVN